MAGKEEELSSLVEAESKSMGSEAKDVCGLKRKAEETEEAAAVDVVLVDRSASQQVVLVDRSASQQVVLAHEESEDEDSSDDYDSEEDDSDEDPEISFAKIKARFARSVLRCQARYPRATYADPPVEEGSHDDDKPV